MAARARASRCQGRPCGAAPTESRQFDERFREAGERFREIIAADSAARVSDAQAVEWATYERRDGIGHPGRTQDRVARQAAAQVRRAPELREPQRPGQPFTVQNRHRTAIRAQGPGEWDDNDPDMMEPAHMLDMPENWRRGPLF